MLVTKCDRQTLSKARHLLTRFTLHRNTSRTLKTLEKCSENIENSCSFSLLTIQSSSADTSVENKMKECNGKLDSTATLVSRKSNVAKNLKYDQ